MSTLLKLWRIKLWRNRIQQRFFVPPDPEQRHWGRLILTVGIVVVFLWVSSEPFPRRLAFSLFLILVSGESVLVNYVPRTHIKLAGWLRLIGWAASISMGGYILFEGWSLTGLLALAGVILVWFAFSPGPIHALEVEQPQLYDDPSRRSPR